MSLHIHDIFNLICKEFPIPVMVNLELISKCHETIIKNTEWYHSQLTIKNDDTMLYFIKQYNFRNFEIRNHIEKNHIDYLQNCHTLNLQFTKLSNKYIKKFHGCHTLNLGNSYTRLKRTTLMKLRHCHTLILFDVNFNNRDLEVLSKCNTICLTFSQVKNHHVKHLKKCHTLGLEGSFVTNKCVKHLKNCHTIYFGINSKIDRLHRDILRKCCFKASFNLIYI